MSAAVASSNSSSSKKKTDAGEHMALAAREFYESLMTFRDRAVAEMPEWEGHCTEIVLRVVLAMPSLVRLQHAAKAWQESGQE